MAATEASNKSDMAGAATAATSSTTSASGFDLINHAIRKRMGSSRASPTIDAPSEASKAVQNSSSELLLKAHLLGQNSAGTTSISRVSSTSSTVGPSLTPRELAASQHEAYASMVGQVVGNRGIVAALQRRHHQPSISEQLPVGMSLQLASYLKTADTKAPSAPAPAKPQSNDEQNARELNPSAFQFPWKLHDMLDRASAEGYDMAASWVENGEAFKIHHPDVFVKSVMPRFFKQTKYKSFQRQLNLYGFTRLHNGPYKGGYKHKYFRQGQLTMCQLITRCPTRDSIITTAMKAADSMTGINTRMIVDEGTASSAPAALSHAASSVSMTSKASSSSLKQKQVELNHHAAAMMAARQQVFTSNFQFMEKARQEQQLQQLQLQQLEAHRLQQLNLQQQRRKIALTNGYVPGMPLAGTDHSTYQSRQFSVSRPSNTSPAMESIKTSDHVLDTSNSSSLASDVQGSSTVSPNSAKSSKEKRSTFHKEFQFPWRLYGMLERANEEDFSSIVSWMPGDDSSFKVHDPDNFVQTVMPKFFHQTKYKSFQRQLNLYGFLRVKGDGGYRHPNFQKGRKFLLAKINRVKIKGNGRPRYRRSANVIESDISHHSNREIIPPPTVSNPKDASGIDVILKAIKAKENLTTKVPDVPISAGSTCDSNSNSTIPSTIDVQMKESLSDSKNGYGLSWRQNPSESFSDWTIEVIKEDNTKAQPSPAGVCAVYHVHRRVLAVGPKKSDYFAKLFKEIGSANRTQLRLSNREATVFPMALDYIYANSDFDLDTEKAYALYSLGERLENDSIVQTVADFYSKRCMSKSNIVEFLKLGQSFQNKVLLEASVLKCSQEIWAMDVESASKIDPGLLLRILVIANVARNQNTIEYDSLKLSQMVAMSVSHASTATLTLEIFRSLTSTLVLPTLDPIAAIELLAAENTLLSVGSGRQEEPSLVSDQSFHDRCLSAIHKCWDLVRRRLSESTELANAMRSIPSLVLYELLMKTTTPSVAADTQTD